MREHKRVGRRAGGESLGGGYHATCAAVVAALARNDRSPSPFVRTTMREASATARQSVGSRLGRDQLTTRRFRRLALKPARSLSLSLRPEDNMEEAIVAPAGYPNEVNEPHHPRGLVRACNSDDAAAAHSVRISLELGVTARRGSQTVIATRRPPRPRRRRHARHTPRARAPARDRTKKTRARAVWRSSSSSPCKRTCPRRAARDSRRSRATTSTRSPRM